MAESKLTIKHEQVCKYILYYSFIAKEIKIFDGKATAITSSKELVIWRKRDLASRLWRVSLHALLSKNNENIQCLSGREIKTSKVQRPNTSETVSNANELSSIKEIAWYCHAVAGFST